MPFVKLDTGILDSSLWSEPAQTCKCWITLLAMADAEGFVRSTAPGIARRANLGLSDTENALEMFESPDTHSRSLNDEGKRIKRIDGGYQIVNYGKYRERDYTAAERMRRKRERDRERNVTRNGRNETVTLRKQKQSTEADKEERKKPRAKCTQKEAEDFCLSIGLPSSDGTAMFLHWEEKGWAKVKDWRLTIRKWQSFGYLPSQKQKLNGQRNTKPTPEQEAKLDRQMIEARERYEQRKRAERNADH